MGQRRITRVMFDPPLLIVGNADNPMGDQWRQLDQNQGVELMADPDGVGVLCVVRHGQSERRVTVPWSGIGYVEWSAVVAESVAPAASTER